MRRAAQRAIGDEAKVVRLLDTTKHVRLEALVLSPPSLYFQVPADSAVGHEGHFGGYGEENAQDIDQLHKDLLYPIPFPSLD